MIRLSNRLMPGCCTICHGAATDYDEQNDVHTKISDQLATYQLANH